MAFLRSLVFSTLLLSLLHTAFSFYLPGVAPQDFFKGDVLQVKVNKLTSTKTQLPYSFYSLPYPAPKKIQDSAENLGEVLRGDRIENSLYVFKMREPQMCNVVGKIKLDAKNAKEFKEKINDEYRVNMILDNLPLVVPIKRNDQDSTVYQLGFHVGLKGQYTGSKEEKYFIHNHLAFTVKYHRDVQTESARIVGFEVKPFSVKHEYDGKWDDKKTRLTTCDPHAKHTVVNNNSPQCTHLNCPVKKKVERAPDGHITEIIYKGQHNHEKPQANRRVKENNSDLNGNANVQPKSDSNSQGWFGNSNKISESVPDSSPPEPESDLTSNQGAIRPRPGSSESEEVGNAENKEEGVDCEPNPKRRSIEPAVPEVPPSQKTVTEPKIIVQTRSEVDLLDDGYRWRKYGQKVVKGNPHPRSYYKCTSAGCNVRKHVERASTDPKAVITTYEGKHNHDVPAARNSSHNTASSNSMPSKPQALAKNAKTPKLER